MKAGHFKQESNIVIQNSDGCLKDDHPRTSLIFFLGESKICFENFLSIHCVILLLIFYY